MSSVYKFYGLDPKRLQLRECLGTDHSLPCNFPGREAIQKRLPTLHNIANGTQPPDVFAVLYWFGFDTEARSSSYSRYRHALYEHLSSGHPALALIYNFQHWVVVSGMDEKGVWITDSNWKRVFHMSHTHFAEVEDGIIMVRRERDAPIRKITKMDFAREYARGATFSAGVIRKNIPRATNLLYKQTAETVKKALSLE
jgi:hypothetical protein